ncbi:MAG: hypothetical protein KatS3mg050_1319 [Litorilinea sp.]|nr:MAG: hypothetical protein KatS3mg050_1319 [Litorilinea sp.]
MKTTLLPILPVRSILFSRQGLRSLILLLVLPLLLAGCQMAMPAAEMDATATPMAAPTAQTPEAQPEAAPTPVLPEKQAVSQLRATLRNLLGEHVLLAASATNAALQGRTAEFEAAAQALDGNSVDIAGTIEAVYGEEAGDAFLSLWRTHIGFFVDYTTGVATQDSARRDQALAALDGYADDFAAFLASANPEIDPEVVAENLRMHVATLTAVIDAQAEADYPMAFAHQREAYAHMESTAKYLAASIAAQFPELFEGKADTAEADLRAALNRLLAEHVFVAAQATNAALGGRTAEFEAAAQSLDNNSQDLAAAIASVYGEGAGEAFLALWRKHIGFFVDYTTAVAGQDMAKKEQALAALTDYATEFGAFLNAANPNLPVDAVAQLLGPHVQTLTAVIDAQAAGDATQAYAHLREAYAHMRHIADALTDAIVAQFPERFEAVAHAMSGETTEASTAIMTAPQLRATLRNLLGEHVLLAASATNAALQGRTAEFEAAAQALDGNSVDIAGTIEAVYGEEAGDAFLSLWRTHIGFFVDYTTGVATQDSARRDQALAALDGYADDFAAFLASANPEIDPEVVAANLREHVATLTAVIDAQGAVTPQATGDQQNAYMQLRKAYAHMDTTAAYLAGAIAAQFLEAFPGDAASPEADLRAVLTALLGEHTFLVGKSAAASLAADTIGFEASAGALDENSQALAAAIGSLYGQEAGDAFLALWRKHIGFFLDYALALSAGDVQAQQQARESLNGYTAEFAAFLNSANPNLPLEAVEELLRAHVSTTLEVIDAASDPSAFYPALRAAYAHMPAIANPLADAIVAQFPEIFGDSGTASTGQNHGMAPMAQDGAETSMETVSPTESMTVTVDIQTFAFSPARLEVPVGTTVVWRNLDGTTHTVTAGIPGNPTGLFDSGTFGRDQTYAITLDTPGTYDYFCARHPHMRGQIVVRADG